MDRLIEIVRRLAVVIVWLFGLGQRDDIVPWCSRKWSVGRTWIRGFGFDLAGHQNCELDICPPFTRTCV